MENVDVIERGKITVNIYEGQKGDPGKALRFEDLTPEQIVQLKGPKGDKGEVGPAPSLDNIYNELKYKGYKAKSNSIEDVIQLLVNKMNFRDAVSDSIFEYAYVRHGDTSVNITVRTAPNATLVEAGTENTVMITDTMIGVPFNWTLSKPIDENDRTINLVWDGQIRKTFTIKGVQAIYLPPLINHIEYQSHSNDKYATAVKDDGKTLYFKSTETSHNLTNIVDLVNIAQDENNLPANIETLVLIIGQPINLDNLQTYKQTNSSLYLQSHDTNIPINVPYNSYAIDLQKLKVNCKNVIIVMDQQLMTETTSQVSEVYVISNRQETISGGTVVNGEMTLNNTAIVSNLSVVKLTYSAVELLGINLYNEHL